MLNICNMTEVGFLGDRFTWRGVRNGQVIFSCLDRCFGILEWYNLFPSIQQTFLPRIGSDHSPVLVKLLEMKQATRGLFRFDKRMADDPNFAKTVMEIWGNNNEVNPRSSMENMKNGCRVISIWRKKNSLNSRTRLEELKKELVKLDTSLIPNTTKIWKIKAEINEENRREEQFWR